jgi:hypothetical protein
MTPEIKQRIQISLIVLLLLATARVAFIFHERKSAATARNQDDGSRALTGDEYVYPKKFYAYDLASAKALTGKSVWVKQGYGNLVYLVINGHVDLTRGKPSLLPIEQLKIADLVRRSPSQNWKAAPGESELLAIAERGDHSRVAVPIGTLSADGTMKLVANDVFYIQDPHQLYQHWPPETWKAIDSHQALPGMNELQVNFALGVPQKAGGGDYGERTLEYSNGGKPVRVSFAGNKAVDVTPVATND